MGKKVSYEEFRWSLIINGDKAQKELYDLEKRNKSLANSTKDLKLQKAQLEAQDEKNIVAIKELSAKIAANNREVKENKSRMRELQKEIGVTGLTLRQLGQRASFLRLQLANMLPKDPNRLRLKQELKEVTAQINKLSFSANNAKGSLSRLAGGFNKYAALGASAVAVFTGMILSIEKVIDFNGKLADSQSNVQKTTGLTSREVDKLTIKLGRMNTRTSRSELLELAEEAGRLGKKSVKDVLGFVEVANQLKVALGDDLSTDQIREVGKMVTIYKVGQKEGKNFEESMLDLGSAINEVSAAGANQADFLVDYLKRQAGVSAQTKVSAADNIGYAATFDEIGQSVEVSATAMNKVWIDMFENTETYANIAGVSVKEFATILNTDANQAMLMFLEGLNGNNEGMSVMVEKLKDIEVGGARGVQALAALAGKTDLLRERQELANKAQKEGISLTNEYNLKNNNAAAILERLKRNIIGAFANNTVVKGIKTLLGGLERLTRGTGLHEKAVREERKELFKLQTRLFNVNTTQGERIKLIDQLKRDYPGLLANINSETASNKELRTAIAAVNDQLINRIIIARQQDKIDEQNEKTAVKQEKFIDTQERLADAMAVVSERVKDFSLDENKTEYQNAIALADEWVKINGKGTSIIKQSRSGYFELKNAIEAYRQAQEGFNSSQKEGNVLLDEKNKLMDKLGINLNVNSTNTVVENETPDYVPDNKSPLNLKTGSKVDQAKREAEALLQLQRETEDKRIAIIENGFIREMEQNRVNQERRLQDLQTKSDEVLVAYDKAVTAGNTDLASTLLAQYHELYDQIELLDEEFSVSRGDILNEGIQQHIEKLKAYHERREMELEMAHNNELAALGDNEEAKKALREQYNRDQLKRQKALQITLITELKKVLDKQDFEGFNLDILTEEQLQKLKDRLASLGLSLSEINRLLSDMKNGKGNSLASEELSALGLGGNVDILGMSPEQWDQLFTRTETLEAGLAKAAMFAQAATEAFRVYHEYATAAEDRKLRKLEAAANKEIANQKRLLDKKLITQKQHDDAVAAQEEEIAKQKAQMEYQQAKRKWQMDMASSVANVALGVTQALASTGPPANFILAGLVGALGAFQIAKVAKNKPVRGYEQGLYSNLFPIQREQDGKMFNASYGGESRSGIVDKPTVFLAGEGGKNFPELIINGPDLKQLDPMLKQSLYRDLNRIKGYEKGYYSNQPQDVDNTSSSDTSSDREILAAALNRNAQIMEMIYEKGLTAYVSKDLENIKNFRDELEVLEKIESKSTIVS